MTLQDLGNLGEFVGAIGVIASLIYLAIQIRADVRARRAEVIHTQTENINGFTDLLATHADLSEIFYQGIQDFGSLSGSQLVRFNSLMGHLFRTFEDLFFSHAEGQLDPRVWRGFERPMDDLIAYLGIQDWWRTRGHWFSHEFQHFVTEKIESGRPPSMYRESAS